MSKMWKSRVLYTTEKIGTKRKTIQKDKQTTGPNIPSPFRQKVSRNN